jgi:hypothetical protein
VTCVVQLLNRGPRHLARWRFESCWGLSSTLQTFEYFIHIIIGPHKQSPTNSRVKNNTQRKGLIFFSLTSGSAWTSSVCLSSSHTCYDCVRRVGQLDIVIVFSEGVSFVGSERVGQRKEEFLCLSSVGGGVWAVRRQQLLVKWLLLFLSVWVVLEEGKPWG